MSGLRVIHNPIPPRVYQLSSITTTATITTPDNETSNDLPRLQEELPPNCASKAKLSEFGCHQRTSHDKTLMSSVSEIDEVRLRH